MVIDIPGVPQVNWNVFDEYEIKLIKALLQRNQYENLAAAINDMSPEKERVISDIQSALRPKSFVFESRAQREFEIWLAQNNGEITPEIEREWQQKIDAERNEYLSMISGNNAIEKVEITARGGSGKESTVVSNNLSDLADLPEPSRNKLNEKGVFTIEEFKKVSYEEKQKILGNKVASRFKDFN